MTEREAKIFKANNVAITGTESGVGFALKMEKRDMRKRRVVFGVRYIALLKPACYSRTETPYYW